MPNFYATRNSDCRLDFLNWPNWQASPPISRMVMVWHRMTRTIQAWRNSLLDMSKIGFSTTTRLAPSTVRKWKSAGLLFFLALSKSSWSSLHLPVRLRQRKRQALRMRVNPSCRGSACIFCLIRMSRARCAIRVSRLKDRSGSLQHRCGGFE
jgi:hypothetical protein